MLTALRTAFPSVAGYNWMNHDADNGADVDAHTIPVIAMYNVTPELPAFGLRLALMPVPMKILITISKTSRKLPVRNFAENVYSVGARYTF